MRSPFHFTIPYSGCWDWLEPVPTGPSRSVSNQAEPKKGPKATFANVVLRGGQECSENTVKIHGSRWTAERSPECASLSLLCRTSTSLGACGWPNGCLVLSSVRGLQMNVCRINGAQHLVERSHECPRRSDQTISMHTRRPYRVWMGLSPSIELNNANGKSVHMPRRIAQSPNG